MSGASPCDPSDLPHAAPVARPASPLDRPTSARRPIRAAHSPAATTVEDAACFPPPATGEDSTPRPDTPPPEGQHLRAGPHVRCRGDRAASRSLAGSSRAVSKGTSRLASPTPEGSTPRPGTPRATVAPPFSTSRTPPPAADASNDLSNLGPASIRADAKERGAEERTGEGEGEGTFEELAEEEARLGAEEKEEDRSAPGLVVLMCRSHGLFDGETRSEGGEEHGETRGAIRDGKKRGQVPEDLSPPDRTCLPPPRPALPLDRHERSPPFAGRRFQPSPSFPAPPALSDGLAASLSTAPAAEKRLEGGRVAHSRDATSDVASAAPASWSRSPASSGLVDRSPDSSFEFPVRALFSDTAVCPRISSDSSARPSYAACGNVAFDHPGLQPLRASASADRLSSLADASSDRLPSFADAPSDRLPSLADASSLRPRSIAAASPDRLPFTTDASPSRLPLPIPDPSHPELAAVSLARSLSLRRSSAPATRVTSPTPLDPASRRCTGGEAPPFLETSGAIAGSRDGRPRVTPQTSPPPARGRQRTARESGEADASGSSHPRGTLPPADASAKGDRSRGSPASIVALKPPLPPNASLSRPGSSATLGRLWTLPEGQPTSSDATPRLALGGLRRHASFCSADAETTRARILEGGGNGTRGRERPKRPREGGRDGSLPPCLRGPPLPRSATESTLTPLGAPWGGIGLGSHWRLRERLLQLQRELKARVADDADPAEASANLGEACGACGGERRQAAGSGVKARLADPSPLHAHREPSNVSPHRSSPSAPVGAPPAASPAQNLGEIPAAPAVAAGASAPPSLPLFALPPPLLPLVRSSEAPRCVSLPEALDEAERNALSLSGTPKTLGGSGACVLGVPLLEHEAAETERQAALFGGRRSVDRDLDGAALTGVALSAPFHPRAAHADRPPRSAMPPTCSPRASGPGPVAHPLPLAHPEVSPTRPSRNRLGYRGSLYFLAGSAACHRPSLGDAEEQVEAGRLPRELELGGLDAPPARPLADASATPPWQERLVSVPGVEAGLLPSSGQIACASEWLSERTPSVLPMRQALASLASAPLPPPWGSYSGLDSGWGEGTGDGKGGGAWDAGWKSRAAQHPACVWSSTGARSAWELARGHVERADGTAFALPMPADGPSVQAPSFPPSPSATSRHLPECARVATTATAPLLRSHPIFPRPPLSHPIAPPYSDLCWTPRAASVRVDLPWRAPSAPPPPAVPSTFSPAARLDLFYRLHRSRQTAAYAGRMRDRAKRSTRGRGTCVQALRALPLVRAPCSPFPVEEHGGGVPHEGGALLRLAFAAARRCREAFPEWPWMEVVGLIHSLGKLLLLDVAEEGAGKGMAAQEKASDVANDGAGTGDAANGGAGTGDAANGGSDTDDGSAQARRASQSALAPGPSAPGWTSAQPTWSVLGDSFPVGCRFAPTLSHSDCFAANPDRRRREYASVWGVYAFECGLGRVAMSWGESEYLACVLEKRRDLKACKGGETDPGLRSPSQAPRPLPRAALWLLRHRQFDALLDPAQPYGCLLSSQDRAMLPALRGFRGALEDAANDVAAGRALEPAEADWERAQTLLRRWGLAGELEW